jgi:hypothetical protein
MNINPTSKIRIQCHALAIHSGSQNHLRVIILRNTAKAKRPNIPCHKHRYTLTGKIIPEIVAVMGLLQIVSDVMLIANF